MKMDRIFRKNSINLIFTIILSSLSTITMISAEIWQGEFGKDVYIEATGAGPSVKWVEKQLLSPH